MNLFFNETIKIQFLQGSRTRETMATFAKDTNFDFLSIPTLEDLAITALAAYMWKSKDVKSQLWELISNYDDIIKPKEKTYPELLNEIVLHSSIVLNKVPSFNLPEILSLKLCTVLNDYNFQIVNYLNEIRCVEKFDFGTVTKALDVIKWTQNGLISKIDSLAILADVKIDELVELSKYEKIEKYYKHMCGTNDLLMSYWHSCCVEKKPENFKIKRRMMFEIEEKFSDTAREFIKKPNKNKEKFIVTMSILLLEPIIADYFLRHYEASIYIFDLFNLFVSEMQRDPPKVFGKKREIDLRSQETYDLVNVLWLVFNELSEEEKLEAFKKNSLYMLKKLSLLWQWQRFVTPLMKTYELLINETMLLDLFEDILKNSAYEAGYRQHFLNIWHNMPVDQKEKFVKYIIKNDDGDRFLSLVDFHLSKILFNNAAGKRILQQNTDLIVERFLRFGRFDVVDYLLTVVGLDFVKINQSKRNIMLERKDKCLANLVDEIGGEFLVNRFIDWGFDSNTQITQEESLKIKEDVVKSFGVKICVGFFRCMDQDGLIKFLDWTLMHKVDDEKFQAQLWKLKEAALKTVAEAKARVLNWESEQCGQILKSFILWRASGDVEAKIWEFQKLFMKIQQVVKECCEWCRSENEKSLKNFISFIFDKRNFLDFDTTVWKFVEKVISETILGSDKFLGEKCRSMFRYLVKSIITDDEEIKTKMRKLKQKLIRDDDLKLILSYEIQRWREPKTLEHFYRFFFDSEDGINLDLSVLEETKESVVEEMMDYGMYKPYQMPKYCADGLNQFFLLGISDDKQKIWELKKWFLKRWDNGLVYKWINFQATTDMLENLSWLFADTEEVDEAKELLFSLKQDALGHLWRNKKYINDDEYLEFFEKFFMWTCFSDEYLKEEVVRLRVEFIGDDPKDTMYPMAVKAANFLTKCLESKFGKDVEDPSIYKYFEIKEGAKDLTDSEDSEEERRKQGESGFEDFKLLINLISSCQDYEGEDDSNDDYEDTDSDEDQDQDQDQEKDDDENQEDDEDEDQDQEDGEDQDQEDDEDQDQEDDQDHDQNQNENEDESNESEDIDIDKDEADDDAVKNDESDDVEMDDEDDMNVDEVDLKDRVRP